ncbi:MAG TPA: hypothetical protein VN840_22025 [Streptosporangiaceae bacterium]|nr:hypothetical protein [Streptosporangiaceae bacterium]
MAGEQVFVLIADVSSDSPGSVRLVLDGLGGCVVTETDAGFHVEGTLAGQSARSLNRELLSALRKRERRTRLRAEWTSGETTERFFDYVPKGSRPAGGAA